MSDKEQERMYGYLAVQEGVTNKKSDFKGIRFATRDAN